MEIKHRLTPYYQDVLTYLAETYGSTGSIEARNVDKESLAMAGVMLDLLDSNKLLLEELKAIKEEIKSNKTEESKVGKATSSTKATK